MSLRDELQSLTPSAWGGLNTLRDATLPDLPRRLTVALESGELELAGLPFELKDVMAWLTEQQALEGVPPSFLVTHMRGDDPDAAWRSAQVLARFPAEVIVALRELVASSDKARAHVTMTLAAALLASPTPPHAELLALRPGLGVLAKSIKGRAKDGATQTLKLLDAIVVAAPATAAPATAAPATAAPATAPPATTEPEALPARDDVAAIAASAPENASAQEHIRVALRWAQGQGVLLSFAELADAAGLSEDHVRPQAAAVGIAIGARGAPVGIRWYARGIPAQPLTRYEHERDTLDPWIVEKLVLSERFDGLDRYLAQTTFGALAPLRKAKKDAPMPRLTWRSGAEVSPKAQRAYLALLREIDLASLLTSSLDEASVFDLGVWLLADPKTHKKEHWVLPPSDRLACELGRADAAGLVSHRAYRYELFSPAKQRWAFRWWTEAQGQTRADIEFTFERARIQPLGRLLQLFPTRDQIAAEGVASEAWWRGHLVAWMQDALVAQRAVPMHAFRRLCLARPLVAETLSGVVFHVEDHGLSWIRDGQLVSAAGTLTVAGHAAIVVAHPAIHTAPWPTEAETGAAPFAQRARPTHAESELADLLTQSPIANAAWRERCRDLGYLEYTETNGGTTQATRKLATNLSFVVHHSGYGAGYGGAKPLTITRAHIDGPAHAAAWSEFVYDLRRLAGLEPIAGTRPAAEPPPPPEVLVASFWQTT